MRKGSKHTAEARAKMSKTRKGKMPVGLDQQILENTKHGMGATFNGKRHGGYVSWQSMKQRCLNVNNKGYSQYGGRGISVCVEWLEFETFWADMGDTWFQGAHLDRINHNKGYSKENCQWLTDGEHRSKTGSEAANARWVIKRRK